MQPVAASLIAARVPYIAVLPTTVHARPEHHHSQYSVSQSVSQQIPGTAAAAATTTTTTTRPHCQHCTQMRFVEVYVAGSALCVLDTRALCKNG